MEDKTTTDILRDSIEKALESLVEKKGTTSTLEKVRDYDKSPQDDMRKLVDSHEDKINRRAKDNRLVYIVIGLVVLGWFVETFFFDNYDNDRRYESEKILNEKIIKYEAKIEMLQSDIKTLEEKIGDKVEAKVNKVLLDYFSGLSQKNKK